jgi:valyl-tRNA synthetase
VQSAAPGHDIPMKEEWIDAARRFGNKIWNAVRFAAEHVGVTDVPVSGGYPEDPGPEDAWILQRLAEVGTEFDRLFDDYRFSDAYGLLYNYAWSEVFDWYIEMAKTPLKGGPEADVTRQTLGVVLRDLLKYFHPAIPHVTEELWSHLGGAELLATAPWPEPPEAEGPRSMATFQDLVGGIRRFRSEYQISPRQPLEAIIVDPTGRESDWWLVQMEALVGAETSFGEAPRSPSGYRHLISGQVEVFIPIADLIDVPAEQTRLTKAMTEIDELLTRSRKKLANKSFRERAPEDVVQKEEAKVSELEATLTKLRVQRAELG